MNTQESIINYIDKIIQSVRKMEKNSEVFSELQNISQELEFLEQYVKTTFDTLENNFNSFGKQINILSELVDFQRSIINYKSSDKMVLTLFEFLHRNIKYDHGFVAFKLKTDDPDYIFLSNQKNKLKLYRQFLLTPEVDILKSLVKERDMAYLISDVQQFEANKIEWDIINAKSVILFPIKVLGKFLGMGFLIRRKKAFESNDLSFLNLNIGLISLLIYQHYYYNNLKMRLIKQFRLRKIMEDVKYDEYFEKGPLYIFTLDTRNIVVHVNTAVISNLKVREEMIIGDNFLEIIPKSYRMGFKKILDEVQEGQIQCYRSPIISKSVIEPILEFYVSKIEFQDNFDLKVIFSFDTTQMYYRDILIQRNEVLDELDQFCRTLAGEFDNLMSIIAPNISLMRTELPADNNCQERLESMEKAALHSSGLLQKIIDYGLEEFETSKTGNLNKEIKSYINSLKDKIKSEIKIEFQLDAGLKKIVYSPHRLKQLLKNIIDNSILALDGVEKPLIRFTTQLVHHEHDGLVAKTTFYLKAGDYVELCVYDNGCGIPEKHLLKIFKPFYSTRIKNEGVGLGLFFAYNIIKDMKGQIYVESKYGDFTAIHVFLPIREEGLVKSSERKDRVPGKADKKKQPTVLVVDDEYNIRTMMKEIMELHGFKVYTAGNGRDGVDVFKRNLKEIDLIILDMVMPVMDGRAAFIEIKKINPEQKIFIISGYSQRQDLDEILTKGAVGFMRKPFQIDDIINKVCEILSLGNQLKIL